jgi:aminomethyltransferase
MARRHTPYYHKLVELGAEMADRIGFDAAVRFSSVADEHRATRERVGVYDVYYQGPVDVKGSDAESFLDGHVVNAVARLQDGQVLYTSVLNPAGGMIDDLTLVRFSPGALLALPDAVAGQSRHGLADGALGRPPCLHHECRVGHGLSLGPGSAVARHACETD